MAGKNREDSPEQGQWQIAPSRTIFFINNNLVKVIASNRGANIVYLYNFTLGKEQTMLRSDFRKNKKRAYLVGRVARLLNVTTPTIHNYINAGLIEPPLGGSLNGEREFHKRSYYPEDYIFKIREVMSEIPQGRPRKDGKVVNRKLLTEQELRAKMGDAIMLYTRTEDGRFIPVWQETTY